jgi:hypothetical protein
MTAMAPEAAATRARRAAGNGHTPQVKPLPSPQPAAPSRPRQRSRSYRTDSGFGITPPRGQAHRSNSQGVILAEFVAAIILTAATPIATNKQAGLSPYAATDVAQLAALTLLYLVLALVSVGGSNAGRVAAWFGGLVLIGVGLGEAASIAKTLDIFGSPAGNAGVAEGSAGPLINPSTGTGG